ncbi:MAG: MFS transporter, partial [SAR86 cluster bacterium]|nr:MFS transporter [SAR86 cluster bacterium]
MKDNTKKKFSNQVKSWIAYDVGNSSFVTTVVAAFFPIFYFDFWAANLDKIEAASYQSFALAVSNIILLFTAPLIGSYSDISNSTKSIFRNFILLGVICVTMLFFIKSGSWMYALVFYALANYFFSASLVLYDKILVLIASPDLFSKVSGYGYAWGYLGGGTLFLINALMTLYPSSFGLESQADAIRWSFLTVSVWWLAFSIPLLITFKDSGVVKEKLNTNTFISSIKNVLITLKEISKHKKAFIFLVAFFLYIDGVHTVVYLASTFAKNLGLENSAIIIGLIIVQFVAFPATIMWSHIGERSGDIFVISFSIILYIFIILFTTQLSTAIEFYLMAALVGSVQGGIQGS